MNSSHCSTCPPSGDLGNASGLERLRADGSREMQPIDEYTLEALSAGDEWVDGLKLHHLVEHRTRKSRGALARPSR